MPKLDFLKIVSCSKVETSSIREEVKFAQNTLTKNRFSKNSKLFQSQNKVNLAGSETY